MGMVSERAADETFVRTLSLFFAMLTRVCRRGNLRDDRRVLVHPIELHGNRLMADVTLFLVNGLHIYFHVWRKRIVNRGGRRVDCG